MTTREGYRRSYRTWQPSDTERQVLDALSEGLSNPEIAARLGLSLNTVKWHIGQIMDETGYHNRADLADWWSGGEEDQQGERAVVPLPAVLGRLLFSPLALGVALVIVASVGLVVVLGGVGRNSRPSTATTSLADADRSERVARIQTAVAESQRPADTLAAARAKSPDPAREAWVFDIRNRTAEPLGFLPGQDRFAFSRWLQDGRSAFGMWPGGYAVVSQGGQVEIQIDAERPGRQPGIGLAVTPIPHSNKLIFWAADTEMLTSKDLDSGAEHPLITLHGARNFSASPDGTLLLFTRRGKESLDVYVLSLDSLREHLVVSLGDATTIACCIEWSPYSQAILLLAGSAEYERLDGTEFEVRRNERWERHYAVRLDDGAVREVPYSNQQPIYRTARWAGADRLVLVEQESGVYGARVRYMDTDTGALSGVQRVDGPILCFSPSARYMVSFEGNAFIIRDTQSGNPQFSVLMRAETGSPTGHCDWTRDESKVLMSFLWGYPY